MHRRVIRHNSAAVSLISFLDILGGTIGALTLIIAIFLIQMGRGNQIVQLESKHSNYQDKTASYIICNGNGVVELHAGGKPQTTMLNSPILESVLAELNSDKRRYLIIGVRPNGFDDFENLRRRAERLKIPVGYEPLDAGWRIRAPGGELL